MNQKAQVLRVVGRRRSALPAAVAAGVLSLGLAGCQGMRDPSLVAEVGAIPDYRTNHPITLTESLATLDIPVGVETRYLPDGMDGNILAFASAFLGSGSSAISIVLPTGSANAVSAAVMATQVEGVLISAGIPVAAIEYRSYSANAGETIAPVRLAYVRIAATTAPCGPWRDSVARNYGNTNYDAFGCATQQNLAAMVANPLDLLYPRMMTPPNAARRATVLGNYQQGAVTGAAAPQETGVAEAAQ
jgi:pilus assembly protein CpaD